MWQDFVRSAEYKSVLVGLDLRPVAERLWLLAGLLTVAPLCPELSASIQRGHIILVPRGGPRIRQSYGTGPE